MSTLETECARCTCGHVFEVQAATSLHVTNDPELRAAIVRGGFHVFPCPACGVLVQLEKLLAYTDLERGHWFAVFPEDALATWRDAVELVETSFRMTVEENSPPIVKSWAPKLRSGIRAVFGVPALREKLLIADADLDDRTVEALKLEILTWYDLPYREGAHLWFSHRDADLLVFAWAPTSGPMQPAPNQFAVPFDTYLRLVCDRDTARSLAPVLHESTAVDFRIARASA